MHTAKKDTDLPATPTTDRRSNSKYPRIIITRSASKHPTIRNRTFWAIGGGTTALLILILVTAIISCTTTSAPTTASTPGNTQAASTVAVPPHQTYNAALPPAPTGPVAHITLTVKEALISIAPGIAYHAWTFNGTVPGPILHVRQGQTIHFTLINEGTMPHSIDFHAAQTPWNVNYQPIPPGKSFSFTWTANYPGVFLYHCGAPTAIYHMANGMYGAIIVDPANGYAPAAKAYVLVQSEFYITRLSDGTYGMDLTKVNNATPDYVVFNGYANQYKDTPLTAKAGQRIRIFIVNAGPSEFSAFHVIGAIFSDAYADGNPANHTIGDQTVIVPPGGATMVELVIPQPGLYPFVTHSFVDVGKGALGLIQVTP
jgi:nitrite reductase (NO-forming)